MYFWFNTPTVEVIYSKGLLFKKDPFQGARFKASPEHRTVCSKSLNGFKETSPQTHRKRFLRFFKFFNLLLKTKIKVWGFIFKTSKTLELL